MTHESEPAPAIDVAVLRDAIGYLYEAVDDLNFVAEDLLRPHRERHWGHLTHAEKRAEAHRAILSDLGVISRMIGIETPPNEAPPGDR